MGEVKRGDLVVREQVVEALGLVTKDDENLTLAFWEKVTIACGGRCT